MSAGEKIVRGTLIAGGVVLGTAGLVAYNAGKYVRRLLYPPTFKKYLALAAIPFVLYGIKNPARAVGEAGGAVRCVGSYISRTIGDLKSKEAAELRTELGEKNSEIKNLEERLRNSSSGVIAPPTPQGRREELDPGKCYISKNGFPAEVPCWTTDYYEKTGVLVKRASRFKN